MGVVGEQADGLVALRAREKRLTCGRVLVCRRGHHAQHHAARRAHARLVHVLLDVKVVLAVVQLVGVEDLPVDELADACGHFRGAYGGVGNGAGDLLLVVGQELVGLSAAAGVVLAHQALEGLVDGAAQVQQVGVRAVHHEDGDVLRVGLDVVHPADEEQQLEDLHVKGREATLGASCLVRAVDDAAHVPLEEGLHRVVEAPEGDEGRLVAVLDRLRGLLEAREHGALVARGALARAAVLAQLVEGLLHELELVVHKGVGGHVVVRVLVAAQVLHGVLKVEEVLEGRRPLPVLHAEQVRGRLVLLEDSALDDLVCVDAGEREAGGEAPLDL